MILHFDLDPYEPGRADMNIVVVLL